jgi:hypothetical protein
MEKLAPYWKAVVGFVAPAAAILISAVLEGSDGGTAITGAEWVTAGCTAVITAAGVYSVRNQTVENVNGRHEAGPGYEI